DWSSDVCSSDLGRQIQCACRDLTKGGKVTLTSVGNTALHKGGTIPAHTHRGSFTRRTGHGSSVIARKFDKRGKTNPQQLAVSSLSVLPLLSTPARVIS